MRQAKRIHRRMDLGPLSHMQACVAVQWSGRLWSGQYRQLQAPLLSGRVRMCPADRRVKKHVFKVRLSAERFEKTRPNTRNRPAPEPGMRRAPVAVTIRVLTCNQSFDDRPLPVGQGPSAQDRLSFLTLKQTISN